MTKNQSILFSREDQDLSWNFCHFSYRRAAVPNITKEQSRVFLHRTAVCVCVCVRTPSGQMLSHLADVNVPFFDH